MIVIDGSYKLVKNLRELPYLDVTTRGDMNKDGTVSSLKQLYIDGIVSYNGKKYKPLKYKGIVIEEEDDYRTTNEILHDWLDSEELFQELSQFEGRLLLLTADYDNCVDPHSFKEKIILNIICAYE